MNRYLLILIGGGLGSVARYALGASVTNRLGAEFPFGTVLINISGSFTVGLLMTLLTERFLPHPNYRLLLVVGFLGGFTTFSSYEWDSLSLLREREFLFAALNLVGSAFAGLVAVWLGWLAAARW